MTDAELHARGAVPLGPRDRDLLVRWLRAETTPIMAVRADQPHGYLRQGRDYVVLRGLPPNFEGVAVDRAWLRRAWPELEEIGSWFTCPWCGGEEAVPARLLHGHPGGPQEAEWAARGMAFQARHASCYQRVDTRLAALGSRLVTSEAMHLFLVPLEDP